MAPSFVPLSGLRVTQSQDLVRPYGLCRNHGNLLVRVSSFADPIFAKTDFRVWTCAIPFFDTLTVEGDVHLVLGEASCRRMRRRVVIR